MEETWVGYVSIYLRKKKKLQMVEQCNSPTRNTTINQQTNMKDDFAKLHPQSRPQDKSRLVSTNEVES